jgi:hypothetical protein
LYIWMHGVTYSVIFHALHFMQLNQE